MVVTVNAQCATELYTLKWFIVCYVSFYATKKIKKGLWGCVLARQGHTSASPDWEGTHARSFRPAVLRLTAPPCHGFCVSQS